MPALTREELLTENIRVQQQELASLQTTAEMDKRLAATTGILRSTRTGVATTRQSVAALDTQIAASIEDLKSVVADAHVSSGHFLTLSEGGKGRIDAALNQLKNLLISRFSTVAQLAASEEKLAALERDNAQLPKHLQI